MSEDKTKLMRDMRKKRKEEGLVRKEAWIHYSRSEEFQSAVKKMKTPKKR